MLKILKKFADEVPLGKTAQQMFTRTFIILLVSITMSLILIFILNYILSLILVGGTSFWLGYIGAFELYMIVILMNLILVILIFLFLKLFNQKFFGTKLKI